MRLGAWDYLPKPISLDYLAERISLLRINEARDTPVRNVNPMPKPSAILTGSRCLVGILEGERIDLSGTEVRIQQTGACASTPSYETYERDHAAWSRTIRSIHYAQHPQKIRKTRQQFCLHQKRVRLRLSLVAIAPFPDGLNVLILERFRDRLGTKLALMGLSAINGIFKKKNIFD